MKSKILKSILFIFPLIFNIHLISQVRSDGFDADYLESLPDEIREDVLKEIDSVKKNEKEKFPKRPSSELSNLETIKDWERFKLLEQNKEMSERYGMQLFRSMQTSFMPVNEPNFDGSYLLSYGDVIEIQIISQKSLISDIEIKRDGSISINNIGKVFIGGLTLDNASNLIKNKIKSSIIGSQVFVSLKNVRDIKVLITGHALFPGIYTLSGGSNLLNALNMAGGINEKGSFRNIEIKRDGKTIHKIDLYDMLLFGNLSYDSRLRSGDSIYINPVGNLARTSGAFNIEAIFELTNEETLEDLLKYAGGVSKDFSNTNLSLNRIDDSLYNVIEIDIDNLNSFKIKNNDSLYAQKSSYGTVEITGQVANPGKYSITGNDTILSIIDRAGGYLPNAYPYGSSLFTEKAKKLEEANFKIFYNELIKYLVSAGGNSGAQQATGLQLALPTLLLDIKNIQSTGRVQVEFDTTKIRSDLAKNTFLSDGDKISIPKFENVVYVYGSVMTPGAYQFESGSNPSEYIARSGGFSEYAEQSNAVLITPNGESILIEKSGLLFRTLAGKRLDVYPGSLIYVPRELGGVRGISLTSAWAPIISSLALSMASLNSIND